MAQARHLAAVMLLAVAALLPATGPTARQASPQDDAPVTVPVRPPPPFTEDEQAELEHEQLEQERTAREFGEVGIAARGLDRHGTLVLCLTMGLELGDEVYSDLDSQEAIGMFKQSTSLMERASQGLRAEGFKTGSPETRHYYTEALDIRDAMLNRHAVDNLRSGDEPVPVARFLQQQVLHCEAMLDDMGIAPAQPDPPVESGQGEEQ